MNETNSLLRSDAFIDGAWVGADDGARFPVTDPANGALLTEVPDLGAAETERAVAAAKAAWPAWRAKTAKERAAILRRWFELQLAPGNHDTIEFWLHQVVAYPDVAFHRVPPGGQ